MAKKLTAFRDLPIGSTFSYNGNHWRKRSSRTAHLIEYDRTFYFGASEIVTLKNQ